MKTLIGLAVVMAALGAGYHLDGQVSPPDAKPVAGMGEASSYNLLIAGNAVACQVTRGRKISDRIDEIKLGEGCAAAYAGLGEVAFWREGPDGDVAFAAKDGRTLVRFASGDGVAYESYRPVAPFISLVAEQ